MAVTVQQTQEWLDRGGLATVLTNLQNATYAYGGVNIASDTELAAAATLTNIVCTITEAVVVDGEVVVL